MRTSLRTLWKRHERLIQKTLLSDKPRSFRLVSLDGSWFWGRSFYGSIVNPRRTKKPRPTWQGKKYRVELT